MEIVADYDIIVDGSDNFGTRYLVNDACYLAEQDARPRVDLPVRGHGLGVRAEPGPLLPVPLSRAAPGRARAVLRRGRRPGRAARHRGLIQATETVKLLLGIGEPLIGRLLTYDALGMRFREVRLRRDPGCPLCGVSPTIKDLSGHPVGEEFCEAPAPGAATAGAGVAAG